MIEPLFGPASSMWTSVSSPGLGWYPMPFTLGPHQANTIGPTFASSPIFAPLSQPVGVTANLPPPMTPEVPVPALIAAVAMRRGQPQGPTTDHEVEDFLYDVFELFAGANDVEVRCENGRIALGGSVSHKRLKHDLGEVAWSIPLANDVQNSISIATRRRLRQPGREMEGQPATTSRKPA
jgi:hypothetical protein